ncbi:hypothetical protein [Amycolatopsis aidingensis]|uniref:hypothetical protein n=1 Tax=Amycolatopsis aidingensis TaxID=2842453 RepID=UPI001C0AD523|nr:hypothetical protein [Amycolatopsis aidingensis]
MRRIGSRALVAVLALVAGLGLAAGPASAAGAAATTGDGHARVLGPDGYKSLKLGMSEQDAVATGLLTDGEDHGECSFYYFVPSEGTMPRSSGIFISETDGVYVIGGTSKMRTPEHIRRGHSFQRLLAAYPYLKQDDMFDFLYTTPVPGNPEAAYRFVVFDGVVDDFGLELPGKGC